MRFLLRGPSRSAEAEDSRRIAGVSGHAIWIRRRVGVRPETMVTGKAEEWVGFACKKCCAPLAVQQITEASKSRDRAVRGWRVTCTSCGATEYYEPGTPMVRITISQ